MARYTIDFSTNAVSVIREIEKVNSAIAKVAQTGRSVSINLDTSPLKASLNTTFRQLDKEIEKLERRLNKLQIGGQPFRKTAASLGYKEGQAQLGRMIAEPLRLRGQAQSFTEGSTVRLQKEMQEMPVRVLLMMKVSENSFVKSFLWGTCYRWPQVVPLPRCPLMLCLLLPACSNP